jgi:pimeloyl-ACP methyl ester carboxylesterase
MDTRQSPSQRLARRYVFDDPDMDLFFVAALGWGPSGGLDIGQAWHVASTIQSGDADSWIASFSAYGAMLDRQAQAWHARGWKRASGEARMKAFAAYRSAWQFADPGERMFELMALHKTAFAAALDQLDVPATFFHAPYAGASLPGVFLRNADPAAPLVLVIGGADTCFEDLYLTVGRNLFERGYSVALADLPGQGMTPREGMHWEAEAEKPVGAVIDLLVDAFGAVPGRIALLGLSLGGYFATRAAGHETRLGAAMASTPFPRPGQLFALSLQAAMADGATPSASALRSRRHMMWKLGARSPQDMLERTAAMVADPARVDIPFLSIVGAGDSAVFQSQAREWHDRVASVRKNFVLLDAASGADGHCQVNNRLRLAQEVDGWLKEVLGGAVRG